MYHSWGKLAPQCPPAILKVQSSLFLSFSSQERDENCLQPGLQLKQKMTLAFPKQTFLREYRGSMNWREAGGPACKWQHSQQLPEVGAGPTPHCWMGGLKHSFSSHITASKCEVPGVSVHYYSRERGGLHRGRESAGAILPPRPHCCGWAVMMMTTNPFIGTLLILTSHHPWHPFFFLITGTASLC